MSPALKEGKKFTRVNRNPEDWPDQEILWCPAAASSGLASFNIE